MRKVFLSGGSGFIGRNLIESLGGDYVILAPRHAELDLTDSDAVRVWFAENRPEAVVHAATKPGHRNAQNATDIASANLRMFTALLEASRACGVERFLFLGSGSEFDMRNYRPKMKEDSLGLFVPEDDTGFSKYMCTRMLAGFPGYVNVRFFGIFGKYEDYAIRFISNAICKVLCDLPITLRQNRRFDYVCAEDGAAVIRRFLEIPAERLEYHDYNVTPDGSTELLELARVVCRVAGKPEHPILVANEGLGAEYSGDNGRLRALFPDLAFTPLEQSVNALYTWYTDNQALIDIEKLLIDK